jgi:hypothetical protein
MKLTHIERVWVDLETAAGLRKGKYKTVRDELSELKEKYGKLKKKYDALMKKGS